jgi:signal transduction histidine kinase
MRLSQFIRDNTSEILAEWESFARTLVPPAETMSSEALRDHAEPILLAIAADMDTAQSEAERVVRSKGWARPLNMKETAATAHGALRQLSGFDPEQLAAEFRALRATVLRQWKLRAGDTVDAFALEDVHRFNEGIDQALAESVASYSKKVGNARDTFLAIFGHDLRNPVSAISGCLRMLHDVGQPPEQRERVYGIATRSLGSVERMITDLLQYTQARLGKGIAVSPQPGNVAELCRNVIEEARAAYSGRHFAFDGPDELTASFDADRLVQVLLNLLANAVYHGALDSPIVLSVDRGEGDTIIEVRNWGDPIPADMQQVIFNPLVQLAAAESSPHERRSTSMGLGLFIAREIVDAHGGSIAVSSSAAAGTAFTIRLKRPERL